MIQKDYIERCYAGWLGKIIGVHLGSPVEGWSMEKIRLKHGILTDYVQEYNDYAADDDTNGPLFYMRALTDYGLNATSEQIGRTILNYVPYEHGFFWWGGYGRSTEHTAYTNLRAGIPAPLSGSIAHNGSAVAEQIGGQIFIDTWGLINPNNPDRAAEYGRRAASVSHDGNGVYGGMFVAACIAAAFGLDDARDVIEAGLARIPADCEYSIMTRDIMRFKDEHGGTWENAFSYIRACWGYDRYPGNCHIIPNAAVMILSLLYGENDFSKTICICTMCGWDTDCNAGNIGAIMGAMKGLDGIDKKWITPVHDFLASSSVIGSLNISDIPECVVRMARYAYRLNGEEYPKRWEALLNGDMPKYNFEIPHSTHSVRTDAPCKIENTTEQAHTGERSLFIGASSENVNAYVKTYYFERDFTDNRYDPEFSPILYPGQTIEMWLMPRGNRSDMTARLFAKDMDGITLAKGNEVAPKAGEWTRLSFKIDCDKTSIIHSVGVNVRGEGNVEFYLDDFDFGGKADYKIDFSKLKEHVWHNSRHAVPQFSHLRGQWRLTDGVLAASGTSFCEAYTGNYNWQDTIVTADVKPIIGSCFRLLARVQGAERCYAATFGDGRLSIEKKDGEYNVLASVPCDIALQTTTRITVTVKGEQIEASIGDIKVTANDGAYKFGCVGLGMENARLETLSMEITEH